MRTQILTAGALLAQDVALLIKSTRIPDEATTFMDQGRDQESRRLTMV